MPDACSTDSRKPKRVAVRSKVAGGAGQGPQNRWHRIDGIELEIPGTLAGFARPTLLGGLRLVSGSNVLAPVCMAADPHGGRSGVGRRPGDARAHAREKCMRSKGNLRRRCGVCVPRRLGSAAIIGVGVASPGTRGRRGILGSLKPSLTAASRFTSCRRQVPSGRNEPGADEAVLKAIVLPATRPPTSAAAPSPAPVRQARAISLGCERHPVLRFQTLFSTSNSTTRPRGRGCHRGLFWLDWAVYSGGQKVDYVVVAVAESAPLMLTLGRGCQNGSACRSISPTRPLLRAAMLRKPVASDNSIAHWHPQESKWI